MSAYVIASKQEAADILVHYFATACEGDFGSDSRQEIEKAVGLIVSAAVGAAKDELRRTPRLYATAGAVTGDAAEGGKEE